MSSPGDWMCGACDHMNFKKRDSCQKCGYAKYGGLIDGSSHGYTNSDVKPGDWYCNTLNCAAHNYAGRTNCYHCGATKNELACGYGANNQVSSGALGYNEGDLPGWKTGDWVCIRPGCTMHNYASRMECYKCKTPRGDAV